MDTKFKPPKDDAEFREWADSLTLRGAKSLLMARRRQRAEAVRAFDTEIMWLDKAIERKRADS